MGHKDSLRGLAGLFLRLGLTAFGGPAAHTAMMQQETVQKRKWFSHQEFLDLMGAVNLIPGPNSTELAMHIGYKRMGVVGLVVAGACFIIPSAVITILFAGLYSIYGQVPQVQPMLFGIKAAVLAVILSAAASLGRTAFRGRGLKLLGMLVFAFSFFGISEIVLLFVAGFVYALVKSSGDTAMGQLPLLALVPIQAVTGDAQVSLRLFLIFLEVGALLYGSGYVLFAFLDEELVATGIIGRQLLIDAIAVGQFTPGPVSSAVTFIGYQLDGFRGASLSTLAIFLPSFVFVGLLGPLLKRLRKYRALSYFIDGVNSASVALILAVCLLLGKEAMIDWRTAIIGLLSLITIFRWKNINSAYIVMAGAAAGWFLSLV